MDSIRSLGDRRVLMGRGEMWGETLKMIRETYHVYNRHDEYDEVAHSDDHEYDLHGQVIGFTHGII
jgi:hypothetical protein